MNMHLKAGLFFLILALLAASGCGAGGRYFGKIEPPDEQRLVYLNAAEPETLDPGKATGVPEGHIIQAMFDGLTSHHPTTLEPMAALATHYETNADSTRFTFYLRGHASPRGAKLPNTDTLREQYNAGKLKEDFSRGIPAPPDNVPARWSDGRAITAHDFVYSWQRVVDPKTAANYASLLYYVKNAEEINSGKVRLRDPATGKEIITTEKEIQNDASFRAIAAKGEVVPFTPADLGVRALDDYTFQVDMRAPTAFFVKMQAHYVFFPVPRHAIEAAAAQGMESSWTRPENIVTSGPFTLREWKPYDKIVLAKNPGYYEAELVRLGQITVLPINDSTTSVNLYKAGEVDAMSANAIPQPFVPVLRRDKKDFKITPSLGTYFYLVNTKKPPFDNLLLRYALNMGMDKEAITGFLSAGQTPATSLVPPIEGYEMPRALEVKVEGKTYDVLSYNPEAARELLQKAGFANGLGRDGRRLKVEIMFNTLEAHKQVAEIVQQQWRRNLNIDVMLVNQEWKVYLETLDNLHYEGVARRGWIGDYVDPNTFLDLFVTGSVNNGSGWTDPRYDAMLKEANSTTDPAERVKKLAECEEYLLRAMPFVPIYTYSWFYLRKPYVRGMEANLRDEHPFKYVWIDRDWEPETDLIAGSEMR
jgi:ABC-type oligopeptide transport system substrate-binding subunit